MTISVLVIDDSRTMRDLVRLTLEGAGMRVTLAVDGVDGIATFRDGRFRAVITDINMPRLDGWGVIEAIRAGDRNCRVPILVLSTEEGPDLRRRARDGGATGWIAKPFEDGALVGAVRQVTGG